MAPPTPSDEAAALRIADNSQSAIEQARDQLFLDTADGVHLDVVTSNFGLDRTAASHGDDEWRAIAKEIMLQSKVIRNVFYRVMDVCVGPNKTRADALSAEALAGDSEVILSDSSKILQVGSLVFDPGLATEETVAFYFRNSVTNVVYLLNSLQFGHAIVPYVSDRLTTTIAPAATSLILTDSSQFPTTGFPYSVMIDKGTKFEEIVVVSANNGVDTLTCSATVNDHLGFKASFIKGELAADTVIGRVFIKLGSKQTRKLTSTGFIRINANQVTEEVVEYTEIIVDEDTLILKTPLINNHLTGEPVELVDSSASVETCSVIQRGVDWEVFETEPDKIKIFIPKDLRELRLIDTSWFHDAVPNVASTTLAANASIGDLQLSLTDATGFPDEAGLVQINGAEVVFYVYRDEAATPNPLLYLTQPLTTGYISGDSVDLYRLPYTSTDLEEGNLRDSGGNLIQDEFPGPYLYDLTSRSPSDTTSTLTVIIPPPTEVEVDQISGVTSLEVKDASLWPAPAFTPFLVRIGRGSGFEEDTTIVDRTLKISTSTTVNTGTSIGDSTLIGVDTTAFPESNGTDPAGYRILIDKGGGNEEIITVNQNAAGATGTFSFMSLLTKNHSGGETVELLNDVLTFNTLSYPHAGFEVNPTKLGHSVEILTSFISLASVSGFTSAGVVWLNFGKERLNVRKRITDVVSSSVLELEDTSSFPTTNYGYQVIVGEGLDTEEKGYVSNNNTGTNRLTFSPALSNTFYVGQYVSFTSGTPQYIEYSSIDGTDLVFSIPTIFESKYTVGERVTLSKAHTESSAFGTDYALKMPPDPSSCVKMVLELIRAAGVEIIFLDNK